MQESELVVCCWYQITIDYRNYTCKIIAMKGSIGEPGAFNISSPAKKSSWLEAFAIWKHIEISGQLGYVESVQKEHAWPDGYESGRMVRLFCF